MAAGIWCGGVILTPSRRLIARRDEPKGADAVAMQAKALRCFPSK